MKFKQFLKLVEIQTKVASMMPLLVGTLVSIYFYGHFSVVNFFLMLTSLLCIDMATTAINNYMDYQKAIHTTGYGYNGHNAIVKEQLSINTVRGVILLLIIVGTLLGIGLFLNTDWLVLFIGAVSFIIGIGYTFGPMPISRTPFGEIVSGVVMGLGILFLAVYIHLPNPDWILLEWTTGGTVNISLKWFEFFRLAYIAMPLVIGIGNIMFANNICDMEEDWKNHRYTLPLSLGKPLSLSLFGLAYLGIYVLLAVGALTKLLPMGVLLVFLTLPIVYKQTVAFMEAPVKQINFVNAVKNFVLINLAYAISWAVMIGVGSL